MVLLCLCAFQTIIFTSAGVDESRACGRKVFSGFHIIFQSEINKKWRNSNLMYGINIQKIIFLIMLMY